MKTQFENRIIVFIIKNNTKYTKTTQITMQKDEKNKRNIKKTWDKCIQISLHSILWIVEWCHLFTFLSFR